MKKSVNDTNAAAQYEVDRKAREVLGLYRVTIVSSLFSFPLSLDNPHMDAQKLQAKRAFEFCFL